MTEMPIACTLSPDALHARRNGLLTDLLARAERHELGDEGLRLQFQPDAEILATLAQVVDAERRCCRFLRFTITVDPDEGPVSLQLSGPAGTRAFLAGLLGL